MSSLVQFALKFYVFHKIFASKIITIIPVLFVRYAEHQVFDKARQPAFIIFPNKDLPALLPVF